MASWPESQESASPHLHPASADQQGRWSLPGGRRHYRRLAVGGWGLAVGGLMRRHQVQSIQHSMLHSVLCLCLFQVGLTVPGRPRCRVGASIGSTADQQGRWSLPGGRRRSRRLGVGGWGLNRCGHRGRADRPRSAADQQGRWSLPRGRRHYRRLGVGGWRFDEAAPSAIDSALDAAL